MSPTVWIVIGLLILANAFYVAAEFGAVGVRRSRVRRLSEDGNVWARQLLPHVQNPADLDRYVAVSQVGITVSSLVLGAVGQGVAAVALAPYLARWSDSTPGVAHSTAAIVVLFLLTAAQVVLGELIPKSLALQFPTEVALATVLPMRWSLVAFKPFIASSERIRHGPAAAARHSPQRPSASALAGRNRAAASPKAATAACSNPTNSSGCTRRCGWAAGPRAT